MNVVTIGRAVTTSSLQAGNYKLWVKLGNFKEVGTDARSIVSFCHSLIQIGSKLDVGSPSLAQCVTYRYVLKLFEVQLIFVYFPSISEVSDDVPGTAPQMNCSVLL